VSMVLQHKSCFGHVVDARVQWEWVAQRWEVTELVYSVLGLSFSDHLPMVVPCREGQKAHQLLGGDQNSAMGALEGTNLAQAFHAACQQLEVDEALSALSALFWKVEVHRGGRRNLLTP